MSACFPEGGIDILIRIELWGCKRVQVQWEVKKGQQEGVVAMRLGKKC